MLKSELILSINKNYSSLSHNDIELITDFFFKKIIESLKEDKNLEIRGFGTFSKKINKEKFVRNPKTNQKIFKKQNYKVHFKIGKILHQRINPLQ
jgi:nucleoid DNA-binding protein